MGVATQEVKGQFSASCTVPPNVGCSGNGRSEGTDPAFDDLDRSGSPAWRTGCATGLRFAILLEVTSVLLLYGIWRLVHLL
jgi:hypothetical protein